jgi:hypothetical protein
MIPKCNFTSPLAANRLLTSYVAWPSGHAPPLNAELPLPALNQDGNGDEAAHALAGEGGVGKPIDSLVSCGPNFGIYHRTAQILVAACVYSWW